jgi:Histidine kinase-, DNA gyrase B-, and HSP90-like ATPase
VPKQNAEVLEVLVGQVGEYRDIDSILGEALRVLRHAELVEPVRNLLHCGALSRAPCDAPVRDYPNQRLYAISAEAFCDWYPHHKRASWPARAACASKGGPSRQNRASGLREPDADETPMPRDRRRSREIASGSLPFTVAGGRMRTEVCGRDEIVVSVEDSGPGIDPRQLEKVFNAFVSTKAHGTGLGLAICRMIVEGNGGRLIASSDGASAPFPRGCGCGFFLGNAAAERLHEIRSILRPRRGMLARYRHAGLLLIEHFDDSYLVVIHELRRIEVRRPASSRPIM